jgi:phosphoglucomutase
VFSVCVREWCRYWTPEAIQIIIKIAVANGVGRIWVGQHGA